MSSELHILFVEDRPLDAELCEHELRRIGLEFASRRVYTRDTYERALAEFAPDLILSDFSMPTDLDGFSALAIAREKAIDVPFVFVSGTIGEERAVEAMKAGATDYVLKDKLIRLGPIVKRALREARDRRAMHSARDALKVSEARFRSFMEHLPGRASIQDSAGRYTYVNPRWAHDLGLDPEHGEQSYGEVCDTDFGAELKQVHDEVQERNHSVQRIIERGVENAPRWWLTHQFPIPDEDGNPAMVGTIALDITEQKLQEAKVSELTWHDPITGLPNRALLHDRLCHALERAGREDARLAVLVWDIKRFRVINDSFGRQVGDGLLREVAKRAAELWPSMKEMGRLSADYFAGFIENAGNAQDIAHLLERSLVALSEPFMAEGTEVVAGITVGIAFHPADGAHADGLLANAEAALRQAKSRGEPYLFYETAMNARVAEKLTFESKLRRALDKDQFVLHYQPKIELKSGHMCGVEALLRWNDPDDGLVAPLDLIPMLEETGLILEVGRWAITKALADWQERVASGLPAPRVAVNVSAMQLRRPDFVDSVAKALGHADARRHGLDLEITESILMENIAENTAKLHALKEMGVNVAIDDFGTGYSSLSYLAKLPVHALKIDRAFISTMMEEPQSMTIVSMVMSLAHTLNMVVVAEGVETPEQAKLLRLLRCDQGQGYLFGKSAPWQECLESAPLSGE